jgi:hypothetical protein
LNKLDPNMLFISAHARSAHAGGVLAADEAALAFKDCNHEALAASALA